MKYFQLQHLANMGLVAQYLLVSNLWFDCLALCSILASLSLWVRGEGCDAYQACDQQVVTLCGFTSGLRPVPFSKNQIMKQIGLIKTVLGWICTHDLEMENCSDPYMT